MSSIRVKDLPEKKDNLNDDDLVVIEDSEDTKKISLIKLRSAFSMDGILTSMKQMLLDKIDTFMTTHSTRYSELEERNKQLEVTCHNLENDHIHDAERIFELENNLIKQSNLIKNLQTEKTNLEGTVFKLEIQKNSLTEQVAQLNNEINSNKDTISTLTNDYKDLQNNYRILKEENDTLKNTVGKLDTRANTYIDNFVNEKNREIFEKTEELMAYIRYYHPDVDNLEV